jgi:hypothetical protein
MSATFAKFVCAVCGLAWSVLVAVKAYGLTIQSWPWLIFGTIGTLVLIGASGAWSKE